MTDRESTINKTRSFRVLGVRIDAVQIPDVVRRMEKWICAGDATHFITLTNVSSVMEANHHDSFRAILNSADFSVPDGMPLVWLGRLRGNRLERRVYGPDLMLDFCRETHQKAYRHFFFGGASGALEQLEKTMKSAFPSLRVVGAYSPPFRPLTPDEDARVVEMINCAAPDVLWVGLGCPKQERWMYDHKGCLKVPVMLGVGAAFDFFSGQVRQAPKWMREHGLEWLFRLWQEPKRLWRRYLLFNIEFISLVYLELIGLRRSD